MHRSSGNVANRQEGQEESRRQALEYRLMLEFHMLREFSLSGLFVFPQLNNLLIWHGVIFVRENEYKGGVFKFKLMIPPDYPAVPPDVIFKSEMYHPLISPTDQTLGLLPQILNWRPRNDCIFKVLAYVKKAFYSPELWTEEGIPNPSASITYQDNRQVFAEQVKNCIQHSESHLGDKDDGSSIRFPQFTTDHQQLLEKIKVKDTGVREADLFDTFLRWFRKRFSR